MKRLITSFVALITLLTPLAVTASALAATPAADNPIQSGLQEAYNLAFGASTPAPAPAPTSSNRKIYAAMGDSVAAGLGLAPMTNPTALDTQCGRSSQAYSRYVAKSVSLPVVSSACSGATAGDIYTKQGVTGPNIPSQISTIYAAGTPQLITMTAGANDARWKTFVKACYAYDCATDGYSSAAQAARVVLRANLHFAFESIRYKSGSNTPPPTYITGYYTPTSQRCLAIQTQVTQPELNWIATQTDAINATIQDVASQYDFVHYVPVSFAGHDLCSTNSWIQKSGTGQFHPTAAGQQQYARALIAAIRQNN